MAATWIRQMAVLAAAAIILAGCEDGANPFAGNKSSSQDPVTTEAAKSVRLVDRDVEAPEIFQITDTALWDGRPSLGGIWVASPDAVNPERVILRNAANGKFVIGALFRRERDNPGPKLQISSDAAEALGMLAGQPGQLNVTALRREDSKTETASVPPIAAQPEATPDKAAVADPIAAAGAAIDRADGVTAANGADAETIAPAPPDDLDPTPREGETKRAARKRARLAARAAAAAQATAPAPESGPALDAAPAAVPSIEVAPIADVTATVAPATGAARVQIGLFSLEANAKSARDTLKAGGVSSDLRKEETNGKVFWSVIANGDGGSKALLAKVKGLGFKDAYVVSG